MNNSSEENSTKSAYDLFVEKRINESQTIVYKAVFPGDTNHHNTMFGGTVMSYMDEVAFLTATRFSRKSIVTVSSDKINFQHPIPHGTIIKVVGTIVRVGRTSVDVLIEVFVESMYRDGLERAVNGTFTLVAINENKRPVPMLDYINE
jgi:acyl-CoA hydrolase